MPTCSAISKQVIADQIPESRRVEDHESFQFRSLGVFGLESEFRRTCAQVALSMSFD